MNNESEQLNHSLVDSVLREELGVEITDLAPVHQAGDRSTIFTGEYQGHPIFVKIGGSAREYRSEVGSLTLLAQHDIPVAHTVVFTEKSAIIDQAVMVQTAVRGTALKNIPEGPERFPLWEDAGRILRRVHEIKLEGFGLIDTQTGKLQGEYDSWPTYIKSHPPDLEYMLSNSLIDEKAAAVVQHSYQQLSQIEIPVGSFLHDDFHTAHIFTDGEAITGLIYFGSALAGDARADLAIAHYFQSPEEQLHFNRGYGSEALDPMIRHYQLTLAVRKVVYRHRNNFTNRMPHGLQRLADSLKAIS